MSVERDERDLEGELQTAEAGQVGIPLDAVCTGCRRVHVKRVSPEEVDQPPEVDPITLDASEVTSFTHICHPCGRVTWWNPVAVLTGLLQQERSE